MNLFSLPPILVSIGVIAGGTLVGFLYFFGIFGKEKSADIKTAKDASEFVIAALEKKVAVLEDQAKANSQNIFDLTVRIEKLITENQILREVLQGRDKDSQEYQKAGLETMKKVGLLYDMSLKTNENIEKLYSSINAHMAMMEKQRTVTITTGGATTDVSTKK